MAQPPSSASPAPKLPDFDMVLSSIEAFGREHTKAPKKDSREYSALRALSAAFFNNLRVNKEPITARAASEDKSFRNRLRAVGKVIRDLSPDAFAEGNIDTNREPRLLDNLLGNAARRAQELALTTLPRRPMAPTTATSLPRPAPARLPVQLPSDSKGPSSSAITSAPPLKTITIEGWQTELRALTQEINKANEAEVYSPDLFKKAGKFLNAHLRFTRTRIDTPGDEQAKIVRREIDSLIKAVQNQRAAERAIVEEGKRGELLSTVLIKLANAAVPKMGYNGFLSRVPATIASDIQATALSSEGEDPLKALAKIEEVIKTKPQEGYNLLARGISVSQRSDLEGLRLTEADLIGLSERLRLSGLDKTLSLGKSFKETLRFLRICIQRYPEIGYPMLLKAINRYCTIDLLAALNPEERFYLARNARAIGKLGSEEGYFRWDSKLPGIVAFLQIIRRAVAVNRDQGFALWARSLEGAGIEWDSITLKSEELTGLAEHFSVIPLILTPLPLQPPTNSDAYKAILKRAIAINPESALTRLAHVFNLPHASRPDTFMPLEHTGLTAEELTPAFREAITHLNLLDFFDTGEWTPETIEEFIGSFPNLETLVLYSAPIVNLPDNCDRLRTLRLANCPRLELKPMPNLEVLELSNCQGMRLHVTFDRLQTLSCYGCDFREPPETRNLTKLTLTNCPSLETLPPSLNELRHLKIVDCPTLRHAPLPLDMKKLIDIDVDPALEPPADVADRWRALNKQRLTR